MRWKRSTVLFAIVVLVALVGHDASAGKIMPYRNVRVENFEACPQDMIDQIIDLNQDFDHRIRLLRVNPFRSFASRDCTKKSMFLVYTTTNQLNYTYPGFWRAEYRNGIYHDILGPEIPDYPFEFNDPNLRVFEIIDGKIFRTEMNSRSVQVYEVVRLGKRDLEAIVSVVLADFQPVKSRIMGKILVRTLSSREAKVIVKSSSGVEFTYSLSKPSESWVVDSISERTLRSIHEQFPIICL